MMALTHEEFINRALSKHGNTYDYTYAEYTGSYNKVSIICKIHGLFEQTAKCHMLGRGCIACQYANMTSSTSEFIDRANTLHQSKYNYDKVVYIGAHKKLVITCNKHGDFLQTPRQHLQGQGCIKCASDKKRHSQEFFIEKAIQIHGNRFDYSKVQYKSRNTSIIITCKKHGDFLQHPNDHLLGRGCRKCKTEAQICTTEAFIIKANIVHLDKYNYDKVQYLDAKLKVIITCLIHGDFSQVPNSHLRGRGCPRCGLSNFSHKAVKWLEFVMKSENIYIQHAKNDGEYHIPTCRIFVDGYCYETNTVYEFYGNCWHGNPAIYEETDKPHPFRDKTAKELYLDTMNREKKLKDLGYNVISIWEKDWDEELACLKNQT